MITFYISHDSSPPPLHPSPWIQQEVTDEDVFFLELRNFTFFFVMEQELHLVAPGGNCIGCCDSFCGTWWGEMKDGGGGIFP